MTNIKNKTLGLQKEKKQLHENRTCVCVCVFTKSIFKKSYPDCITVVPMEGEMGVGGRGAFLDFALYINFVRVR